MATPQAPHYAPQAAPRGNGIAVAGFVCGLLGLLLCFFAVIGWILALLGIIFSAIGIGKAKKVGGRGKGLAIGGLVCGALGLIAGIVIQVIVIGAFTDYMKKSKHTASSFDLRRIERGIKEYNNEKSALPPSSTLSLPDADGAACMTNDKKMPAKSMSEWASDPAWGAIGFSVDEPSHYTYHWTKVSNTEGYITAVADLDCDGQVSITRVNIHSNEGYVTAEYLDPTPD